jgi:hypothetical protein
MKKLLLLLWALSINVSADLSVKQIQEMVSKIHQKREGIKLDTLVNTKEPFVRLAEENNVSTFVIPTTEAQEDVTFVLHAIMNGKAYINDKWVSVDEKILGFDLKFIGKRGVILRNENHIKKLFLYKKKDSFIKLEERD